MEREDRQRPSKSKRSRDVRIQTEDATTAARSLVRSLGLEKAQAIWRHLVESHVSTPSDGAHRKRSTVWLPINNPGRAAARLRGALGHDEAEALAHYLRLMIYERKR